MRRVAAAVPLLPALTTALAARTQAVHPGAKQPRAGRPQRLPTALAPRWNASAPAFGCPDPHVLPVERHGDNEIAFPGTIMRRCHA
jgi:hypothetical protein